MRTVRLRSHPWAPRVGLVRDPLAAWSLGTLLLLGLVALLAPLLVPGDPTRINLSAPILPPSPSSPLGTDLMGRDLLGMAVHAARVSLAVGISAAAVSALLGVSLGLAAAHSGGWVDALVSRLVDASLAMPAFFVIIAVQALLGQGAVNVVIMVALAGWMPVTRVVRASVLSLREREFILAARSIGCPGPRIVLRHLLPNVSGQIAVLFALGVADALLMESALSFLGLGVPATQPSWGNMLADSQAGILSGAWWVAVFPGALIVTTALAINLLGDGLQAAFTGGSQ